MPPVLAGSAWFGFFRLFFCRFLPVLGQHSAGFGRSGLGSVSFSLVCSGFRASLENRLHTIWTKLCVWWKAGPFCAGCQEVFLLPWSSKAVCASFRQASFRWRAAGFCRFGLSDAAPLSGFCQFWKPQGFQRPVYAGLVLCSGQFSLVLA